MSPQLHHMWHSILEEFNLTLRQVLDITGDAELLDRYPILQRTLAVRDTYLDPISHLQVALLERSRESATMVGRPKGGDMPTDLRVELPDGPVIGYAEVGNPHGPPVVHLHGNPGSRLEADLATFRRAAEHLGIRLLALDRPGIGLSSFHSFALREYPQLIGRFAEALGLERFAVIGFSGGGKYASACAWVLPDRVSQAVLVSSTCSRDLPGAKATWTREARLLYPLADRAPWLVRMLLAKVARDARRDATSLLSTLEKLGPTDREMLGREEFRT